MPAISTQGLASGFQAGFGMARQAAQDDENRRRYDQEQEAKQQAIQLDTERYNARMAQESSDREATAAYRQSDLEARAEAARLTAEHRANMEQFERDKFDRDNLKEEGLAYFRTAGFDGFEVREDLEGRLKKANMGRYLPSQMIDVDNHMTIQNLARMSREILDTGDLGRANQPEFLDSYNRYFDDEINKGVGEVDPNTVSREFPQGKVIKDKQVVSFNVGPNGRFTTSVKLIYADGTQSEPRPVTLFRSTDPNDPVAADDPQAMIDMIFGRAQISEALQGNRQRILDAYNEMSPNSAQQNKPPANVQTIEYLAQYMSKDQAIDLVMQSKGNPLEIASRAAATIAANNPDESYDSLLPQIFSTLSSLSGGSAPQTATEEQTPAPTPEDEAARKAEAAKARGLRVPGSEDEQARVLTRRGYRAV